MALLGCACGPQVAGAGDRHDASDSGAKRCRPIAETGRPKRAPPAPAPPPRVGEVWLSLDLPLSALEAEFERYVPRTLAAEKDLPIGPPGQVTYRVTRKKPQLRATDGRITATLPVEIELSLCKPFGSLCIGYGKCTPAYDIKASWDLTPTARHELPPVRLSQKATEGCRVGVDVTEHVTSVVKDQLRDIEQRIAGERPPLAPWLDRAIEELTRPSMLAVGTCIALEPSELLLDGPATSAGRITWGIGLSGTMVEKACDAVPHRGRGLPVSRRLEPNAEPTLELRQHVSSDSIGLALGQAIERASKPELRLRLLEHALVGEGLLMSVELAGQHCGQVWAVAALGVHGARLVLENPRLEPSNLDARTVAEVEASLAVTLDLESMAPRWLHELAISERTDILGTMLRERTQMELRVRPPEVAAARVVTAPDGVWILTDVRSRLTLEGRAQRAP